MQLTTASKTLSIGLGAAAGIGLTYGARALLPSPEREIELETQGVRTISEREATATFAPMAFVAAAAIGTGVGRRATTSGMTTVSLGAAAMLASTAASAMINADTNNADEFLRTLGMMSIAATAGFALGAPMRVPEAFAKRTGLALLGVAAGAIAPETGSYIKEFGQEFGRSLQYRE
jgi:hypothetical protein